jgi:hypothetical protein
LLSPSGRGNIAEIKAERDAAMKREELVALRDAIDLALALPDSVRAVLAQWLRDDIPKSSGLDAYPPPAAPKPHPTKRPSSSKPSSGPAKAAEKRLLTAMLETPGQSMGALARASGAARSTTQVRLKRLEERGAVEKATDGRWRIAGEEAGPTPPPLS